MGCYFVGLPNLEVIYRTLRITEHDIFRMDHNTKLVCSFVTVCIFITARKRNLRRLCFYRCLSFCPWGGVCGCSGGGMCGCPGGLAWLLQGGHVWLLRGGMRGCSGGHAWLLGGCMVAPGGMRGCSGGCMVLLGGHAWFFWGVCVVLFGGMRGFIQGACMVLFGGGCAWFFSFFGYNEIRSMSGRYASYWNVFL